jgi:sec-independent protein translocase protein TatC
MHVKADATPGLSDDEGRMSLIEHLTELRSRLIKSVLAISLGAVVGFILYQPIFDVLIDPYRQLCEGSDNALDENCRLLITDPLEGFSVRLKVSTYGGIALAMPVLLWQLWRFVSPGLYAREKRYAIPFIGGALALFVMGAGIAYWTMPKAIEFLVSIAGEDNVVVAYSPAKYFQLIVYMMLAFGIGFQFPIVLIFLQLIGVLDPATLAGVRRYAIVGIAVLVAVITPSADPISMLALTIPMVIFYEISIVVGRVLVRRRDAETEAALG